jgi:hypothetical protein
MATSLMITEQMRQAFYEGKRSQELPLVINDAVTVIAGNRIGAGASVISPEAAQPDARYLIEYADGTSEVRLLRELQRV